MAAPTFIAAGAVATDVSGAASTTPTPPTHQTNDILIAMSVNAAGSSPTQSTSTSGWTAFAAASNAAKDFRFWWKLAPAAGTAGPTITAAGTDQFSLVFVIRGCRITGNPWDTGAINGNAGLSTGAALNNSASPSLDSITTPDPNALLMGIGMTDGNTTWGSGNPPAGWTSSFNTYSATGTTAGFWAIHKNGTSSGNPAIGTFTGSLARDYGLITISFVPPPTIKQSLIVVPQAISRAAHF